jgi:hypothetical protein
VLSNAKSHFVILKHNSGRDSLKNGVIKEEDESAEGVDGSDDIEEEINRG